MNRREFAKLTGATIAGLAMIGPKLWAGDFIKISDILDFTAPDPILLEGGLAVDISKHHLEPAWALVPAIFAFAFLVIGASDDR